MTIVINWFPVADDSLHVVYIERAPIATDSAQGGIYLSALDELVVSQTADAGTDVINQGWRISTIGELRVTVQNGAAPAGSVWNNGFLTSPTGRLYVTTDAVDHYIKGVPVNVFGAVCVIGGGGQSPGDFTFFVVPVYNPTPEAGVNVTWTAATGATSYEVRRNGVLVHTHNAATAGSWNDQTIVVGGNFVYTMRAINANGNTQSVSNPQPVTFETVPAVMVAPVATAGNATASIAFTPPADGGTPITNYAFSAYIGVTLQDQQVGGTVSPYVFTGLTNGQTYTFTVAAVNARGGGVPSPNSNAVTPSASGPAAIFTAPLVSNLTPSFAMGTPTPVFTRNTIATVLGYANASNAANGQQILTVGINNVARFNGARINPTNDGFLATFADTSAIPPATLNGYIGESQATNNAIQSAAFDNVAWTKAGLTVVGNTQTAPDNTLTADTITVTAGIAVHECYQLITALTSSLGTISVFAKAGTASWMALTVFGEPNVTGAYFNLATGVVGTVAPGFSASITSVGNGWYRCSVYGTAAGSFYHTVRPQTADNQTGGWNANGTETIHVWGGQAEAGGGTSSYIATTTTAVTRSADALSYPKPGNFPGGAAGTYYNEIKNLRGVNLVDRYVVGFGGTGISGMRVLANSSQIQLVDSTGAIAIAGAATQNLASKVAGRWDGSNNECALNGVLGTPVSTAGPIASGSSYFFVGNTIDGQAANGIALKNINIYDVALSDAQMIAITS